MRTKRYASFTQAPLQLAWKLGGAMSLLLAVGVSRSIAGPNPPPFLDLGTLGGSSSDAIAINRAGQVVGDAETSDGSVHPFIWDSANGMRDLGGGSWGNANAINNLGQVVGGTVVGQIQVQAGTVADIRPFIWDATNGMQELETPPNAFDSIAYGINDSGQVVGQVLVSGQPTVDGIVDGEWHAVLWDPANGMQMQDLGSLGGGSSAPVAINTAGQVFGISDIAGSQSFQGTTHSFVWDSINGMRDLSVLAGDASFQVGEYDACNDAGTVAGTTTSSQGAYRLAVWDPAQGLLDLGSLGNGLAFAYASSIDAFGDIVGSIIGSAGQSAFLYDTFHGLQNLSLGSGSSGFGINDAGQVVGSFQSAPGLDFHAFLLNPPAPVIDSLSPNTIPAGSAGAGLTLAINGQNFRNGATVLWNGSERPTTLASMTQLTAQISTNDIAGGTAIVTVVVTVRNPNGALSDPASFTITPADVAVVQSGAADPGVVTTVSTAPTTAGQAGVTATVNNTGADPVSVTVANYSSDPSGTGFSAGGGFTDVQISGADSSMTATAYFYYPSTLDPATEAALSLVYYNGSAWVQVLSDGGAAPIKDMTANLDGTISGGRFTVTFSDTSTPKLTELQGTFFASANHDIDFTGFLSPIGGADATGGTFASPLRTFKMGSTIPVKFSGTQYGASLVKGVQTLQVIKYSDLTTDGTPIDATPQDSATAGNQFRLADGQWIFNLDTEATGMSTGIWLFRATLSDGSQHIAWIQLK